MPRLLVDKGLAVRASDELPSQLRAGWRDLELVNQLSAPGDASKEAR